MKAFWALVGLLMMGAAAYLIFWKSDGGGAAAAPVAAPPAPVAIATAPPPALPTEQPRAAVKPVAPEPKSPDPAVTPRPAAPAPSSVPSPTSGPEPATKMVGPLKPPDENQFTDTASRPAPKPPEPAPPASGGTAPAPTGLSPPSKPPEAPPPSNGSAESAGPKITVRDDGSMIVDDRYVLRGKGTASDPYKVTWDQLLSAQDEYVPKEGRKKLPGRITMLDGKVVELTGYIAFPVMAETQDECLSMMNQWDGCCIGVPPTPYDAVEVRLKDPATGSARLTTYGGVKGKLKVDPHLVGGWLVGLYVMDNAEMKPQSYGGFAP